MVRPKQDPSQRSDEGLDERSVVALPSCRRSVMRVCKEVRLLEVARCLRRLLVEKGVFSASKPTEHFYNPPPVTQCVNKARILLVDDYARIVVDCNRARDRNFIDFFRRIQGSCAEGRSAWDKG